MQLPALITSDLHLVASESASYRFDLFPWLIREAKAERVKSLYILGDVTDAKDNHNADLVNKIVQAIWSLAQVVPDIKILAGNHDWLLRGQEFFRFLDKLSAPGTVKFITDPYEDPEVGGPSAFFLPYSKTPAKDWEGFDFSHYQYLFMHQTVTGSRSSNGQVMEGEELPPLNAGKVYSGDIHVPQVIGDVEYVGSPYHVHFGDAFKPRVLLLEKDGTPVDLHFKTISRVTLKVGSLRELERVSFKAGDQVKLRIELAEADKHEWSRIRREAMAYLKVEKVVVAGVELIVEKSGVRTPNGPAQRPVYDPSEALTRYVEREELGGYALELGMEVIES